MFLRKFCGFELKTLLHIKSNNIKEYYTKCIYMKKIHLYYIFYNKIVVKYETITYWNYLYTSRIDLNILYLTSAVLHHIIRFYNISKILFYKIFSLYITFI